MLDSKFWRKYFTEYDTLNRFIPYSNLISDVSKELNPCPNEKILDVGSGTGNLSIMIAKSDSIVTSIDYSEAGVEVHKLKYPEANTVIHDITQPLPFDDSYFDKIVSNNVFYTISAPVRQAVLKECYRVLKPGGIFVIANLNDRFSPMKMYLRHICLFYNSKGILRTIKHLISLIIPTIKLMYYNYRIARENTAGSYNFFSENQQKTELLSAGFKVIKPARLVYEGFAYMDIGQK